MKKFLILAMLMGMPFFASASESFDISPKFRMPTEKEQKKKEKAERKELKERKKQKYKQLDLGYKAWRHSEHRKHKEKYTGTYFSPDKGEFLAERIKRDSNGDRV